MARTIQQIQNQIVASIQADTTLYDPSNPDPTKRGLTTPSLTGIWLLLTYIAAGAINFFENLLDIFKTEIEAEIVLAPPGTGQWIQQRVFEFQYDATTPQVAQLVNFVVQYPLVDISKRIITQCAVTTNPNKVVQVKVASNSTALSSPQQLALASYLDMMDFAGVIFNIISLSADLLMVGATIYYDGQYAPTIQASVIASITNFLATSNIDNFNGTIKLSAIEDVIQAVPGVIDVKLTQIEYYPASGSPATAIKLVDNSQELLTGFTPEAGYSIPDTASGRDLSSTLTFIVQ